jgi:capsule polysaccharide export protein KpsE/RkpR
MENIQSQSKPKFSDYIYILYKWRKFIIINLIIIGVIMVGITLLMPNKYKATSTIMVPPDNQMNGLGGLTSFLSGKSSIASVGSRIFGVSNTSEDLLMGIITSRTAMTDVITKYNLMKYYKIEDNNIDKAIKALQEDIITEPNEYGMINFSVINKDPKTSALIANYLVRLVDSLNIQLNIQRAKNNRIFIEQRYFQNVADLRKAEDSLYKFQKKYGIVAIPEQLEVTVKAAAEVESQLNLKEMEGYLVKGAYGENSPHYQGILAQEQLLRNKINELKNSSNLSSKSNILYPFKEMPDIAINYLRTYRNVEIQQAILEIVMPMYEQAKVEEQKSIPTIMIIDKAVPPKLKDSPKRTALIAGIVLVFGFLFIPLIFLMEKYSTSDQLNNPLQLKLSGISQKIRNFYRIK